MQRVEPVGVARHRESASWSTGRLEAFSDGVFAIAITLLVLEIAVPESDFDDLWKGIANQWPAYLGYLTSFVTIGAIWLGHHSILRRLASADAGIMRINLLVLLLVAFLPFPTKLLAEAIGNANAESAAVIFYGLCLLATTTTINLLWRYVAAHPGLLKQDVSDEEVTAILNRTTPSLGFYVLIILAAIFIPQVAVFGYLLIGVYAVFSAQGEYRPAPA